MWGTVVKGLSIWMIENCRVFFFSNDIFSVLKFSNRDSFYLSVTIIRGYLFYFWSNYHSGCSADFFLSQFTITIQEHYWFLNVVFVPICFSERESIISVDYSGHLHVRSYYLQIDITLNSPFPIFIPSSFLSTSYVIAPPSR